MQQTATVRDHVKAIQTEMRSCVDITPDRASEMLNQATALLGNCNDELRAADQAYKQILLHCLRTAEKANRAKIEAETSPQYARWQEARDVKDLTVEMIRSLKVFIRSKQEEMRLSR
jgi:hypothetical protein